MHNTPSNAGSLIRQMRFRRDLKENVQLYLIMLPALVLIWIFCYKPLYGVLIAFQDYLPGKDIIGEGVKWVGLKHFDEFVNSFFFDRILRNTLVLSGMTLLIGFWVPVAFALLLNEVRQERTRKVIQTISYLPHFISSVVVAGMVLSFISNDGMITYFLSFLGIKVRSLNTNANAFPWIYTLTKVWKSFGWSSILYLSTISSIDTGLYESAEIDGATRFQRMWYVTLPHLVPIIVIQLIFAVGGLMGSDTDLILLLYNPSVYRTADVIGTYVYRDGLMGGRFSFGTAAGLLMSLINFILVLGANKLSSKLTDYALW